MTIDIASALIQLAQNPKLQTLLGDRDLTALLASAELNALLAQAIADQRPPTRFTMGDTPDLDTMTLIQATFFDNGMMSKTRFAITVEAWTKPKDDINLRTWQWKKTIGLIHAPTFTTRIEGLIKRGSISQAYHDLLLAHLEANPDAYFGLVADKSNGTRYLNNQFVVCCIEAGELKGAMLSANGKDMVFETWATSDLRGNSLKGKARYQCRFDLCDFHSKWHTQTA